MNFKHGACRNGGSPEYRAWAHLRNRCNNPRDRAYANYGGRGIEVCERWDLVDNFLEDMGPRPGPEYSIDRIDNDGNYEPDNCRWTTDSEQNSNRRPRMTCKCGHPLRGDGADIYIVPSTGEHRCRTCYNARARAYQRRVRGRHVSGESMGPVAGRGNI